MTDIEHLRDKYEKAEQKAQELQADKDDALQKVRDRFFDRLRKANDDLAEAQKALLDAEAAQAIAVRRDEALAAADDDAGRERVRVEHETLADNLGLARPE